MDEQEILLRRLFAARLSQLRAERDLTLTELSDETGISISSLSQYENSGRAITALNAIKLARFFNVSMDFLLGLVDKR